MFTIFSDTQGIDTGHEIGPRLCKLLMQPNLYTPVATQHCSRMVTEMEVYTRSLPDVCYTCGCRMPSGLLSGFAFPSFLKDGFQTLTYLSLPTRLGVGTTWLFLSLRLKAFKFIFLFPHFKNTIP